MRNDNTYAQIWANHVSDCISDRNNLTTWDDFSSTLKDLHKSVYSMMSMSTDTVFLKKVIYNDPATIAFWSDGTKTVVKAQPGIFLILRKDLLWLLQRRHAATKETITTASRSGYLKNQ